MKSKRGRRARYTIAVSRPVTAIETTTYEIEADSLKEAERLLYEQGTVCGEPVIDTFTYDSRRRRYNCIDVREL